MLTTVVSIVVLAGGRAVAQPSARVAVVVESAGDLAATVELAVRDALGRTGAVVLPSESVRAARAFVGDPTAPLTPATAEPLRIQLGAARMILVELRDLGADRFAVSVRAFDEGSATAQFGEAARAELGDVVQRLVGQLPALAAAAPAPPPPPAPVAAPAEPVSSSAERGSAPAPSASGAPGLSDTVSLVSPTPVAFQFTFTPALGVSDAGDFGLAGLLRLSVPIAPGPSSRYRVAVEFGSVVLGDFGNSILGVYVPVTAAFRILVGRHELSARAGASFMYVGTLNTDGALDETAFGFTGGVGWEVPIKGIVTFHAGVDLYAFGGPDFLLECGFSI